MAVSFLSHEVSDLCIGKPAVRLLPLSATVGEALQALRKGAYSYVCLFAAGSSSPEKKVVSSWKVGVADVLCYLCGDEKNLADPAGALKKPVSVLLPKGTSGGDLVRRVEPNSSLLAALDVILDGADSLIVPLRPIGRKKNLSAVEFCLLSHEDFVRHILNSIALLSPIAALTVSSLGLIRTSVLSVHLHDPALSALPLLRRAIADGTSVAVLTPDGRFVGEISSSLLASCDEASVSTTAAAIAALSVAELMAYIDYHGSPPEFVFRTINTRLREKGFNGMADLMEEDDAFTSLSSFNSSSSSDDESGKRKPKIWRSGSYGRRSSTEVVVCNPGSSLMAVMLQALSNRVGYVWVVEEEDDEEGGILGIVTFADVLRVFREQFQ
ncbi:CBS domain-containing protein CBSX5-like [Typha angustifolia]|uniref:CBS domain-containing protein CBSX5-like n=1 Tax=Typha angustifolia TaxID=59011 RepID=UPI003C2BA085